MAGGLSARVWLVAALAVRLLAETRDITGCAYLPSRDVVAVPVRVFSRHGKVPAGLNANNFQLTVNRTPKEICGIAHQRMPVSVGILLDTSGSMRDRANDLLAIAREGAGQILDGSGPQDEFFLEYINSGPSMQCQFSCDRSHLRAKLQQTAAQGKTALTDAILLALYAMKAGRFADRALVVFTDALDNVSVYNLKELSRAFDDSPVPVFLVVLMNRWYPGMHHGPVIGTISDFVKFANESGGCAVPAFTTRQMRAATALLGYALREPYKLYFVPADPRQGNVRTGKVRVSVTGVQPQPLIFYDPALR